MKSPCLLVLLMGAIAALAQAGPPDQAVAIDHEPSHHLAIANAYLRAFKVEVAPHASTLLHRHDRDYIFVTLGATRVENDLVGKPPVELSLADGEVRFVHGPITHRARNLTDAPFRNVTIEFLGKPRPEDEQDAHELRVLDGGTVHVLFVKDGIRVSDVQLSPGASIPQHHHTMPHMVVAVTNVQLRNDVEGKPSATVQIPAGDVRWVEGEFTHSVTNTSSQPVRFITLEVVK